MTERASNWSVTLNMKNISQERCEEFIEAAKGLGWGIEGQIEAGEEGTRHYQLLVKTPQIRFSAVKKVFPTAHIEKARNVAALKAYVHKDETRLEEFKTVENKFVQFKEVRDRFFEWIIATCGPEVETGEYERMRLWDQFIGISITENIECDVIGVNPQYRSCIQRYWSSYVRRQIDRQTDRQTEESSESISIPTLNAVEGNDEEGSLNSESNSEGQEGYSEQDSESETSTTRSESIHSGSSEELHFPVRGNQVQGKRRSNKHVQWVYC